MPAPPLGLWLPAAALLDMAVPIVTHAYSLGLAVTVYLVLVIIAGEGLVLRWLDRSQPWRTVWKAAAAMNVATALVGIVFNRSATDFFDRFSARRGDADLFDLAAKPSDPGHLVAWFSAFAFLWLATTLIEAVVLHLFRRDGRGWRTLAHSAVVNAVSYVPMALGLLYVALSIFHPGPPYPGPP